MEVKETYKETYDAGERDLQRDLTCTLDILRASESRTQTCVNVKETYY